MPVWCWWIGLSQCHMYCRKHICDDGYRGYILDILEDMVYTYWYIGGYGLHLLIYWGIWFTLIDILEDMVYTYWYIGGYGLHLLIYWRIWFTLIDILGDMVYTFWYIGDMVYTYWYIGGYIDGCIPLSRLLLHFSSQHCFIWNIPHSLEYCVVSWWMHICCNICWCEGKSIWNSAKLR